MIGPMLFGLTSYFFILIPQDAIFYDDSNVLTFIPVVVFIIAVPAAFIMFKSQINGQLQQNPPTERKLAIFQTAHIIRMALLESAALIGVVVCIITKTYINYIPTGIAILLMLMIIPSEFKISEQLKLSRNEQQQLFN